jgi:hypothetical protein
MVDVKNKKCIHPNCTKLPYFNSPGQKVGLYCKPHKQKDMINVKTKTCIHPDCTTVSNYNLPGQKAGIYCALHQKDGMVDVKNKKCIHPNCTTIPNYNFPGQKVGLYCKPHQKDDMVDVKNKLCIHPDCDTLPNYNFVGQKVALYCVQHKSDIMVDVKNKTCKSEWCNTCAATPRFDGYCSHCFTHLFPDNPHARNYKNKEKAVATFVQESFPEYDWLFDKKVYDGCSRRRPDIMCDFGTHVVIVEVDENQHTNYETTCENKRTMELSKDCGHRPLVFVRFNPDGYTKNGQTQKSCWTIHKLTGLSAISKTAEWKSRLSALQCCISACIITVPDKTITEYKLYYN